MKALFVLLAGLVLFQNQAQAKSLELKCGGPVDKCLGALKPVKSAFLGPLESYVVGEVTSTEPLCPASPGGGIACFLDGTRVEMTFLVQSSCTGSLQPLRYSVSPDGERVQIAAVFKRHPGNKICPAVMTEVVRHIDLVNVYLPFSLSFLTAETVYLQ